MDSSNLILQARRALKLVNEIEESDRREGLGRLADVLKSKSTMLIEYGYDKLIMKEIIKLSKFESPPNLILIFRILQEYYAHDESNQDEIMETLLYIYGLSSKFEVVQICVDQMSIMLDCMEDNVAKHSKQIMQAADMNNFVSLNDKFIEILEKLKDRLPPRKNSLD